MNIQEKIQKLPDSPGVYKFKNEAGDIIYVGKATSLRSRVRSYFAKNLSETRGPLIIKMMSEAADVDFVQTDSVLEALILEAKLIKDHLPRANTEGKDDKSFNHVVITREKFPRVLVLRGRELERVYNNPKFAKAIYGPFPNGGSLREAMRIIRRMFPYRTKCIPVVELPPGKTPRPCFEHQIGLCPGVCTGEVTQKEYAKTIHHLMMFFDGRKKALLAALEREMKTYAKQHEFEKASRIKKTVFALQHIRDVALIKRDVETGKSSENKTESGPKITRIEAYDIAHMAGKSTAGVMTVVEDGVANSAEYRMFRIRQSTAGDDLKALGEVLTRRFNHPEWRMPDVVVIDGGETHLNHAKSILAGLNVTVPAVSVVKGPDHKPKDVLGDPATVQNFRNSILLASSEAHRFAIKYHKNLRGKAFL